jgi:uncharacterized protein (TIGR01244 family)
MRSVKITEKLSVAAQPAIADFPAIAAAGFTTVINGRPDGEEPGRQPGTIAEEKAAREAGLAYQHIPVAGPTLSEADIRAFQSTLANSKGPVFAHCKSGTRTLTLYALGEALDGRLGASEMRAFGERFGFDLRGAEAWLAHRAEREGRS